MGKLDEQVALVSGGARGQGRAHCVRLAAEGARIVTFDLVEQIDTVAYPMATPEDLAETVKLVEAKGGEIHAVKGDVRDGDRVASVVHEATERYGRLDIVIANAGIMPILGEEAERPQAWRDAIDVMLTGVFNTVHYAIPAIAAGERGGSIVITSSTAGLKGMTSPSPGAMGYTAAKHGVVGLMRAWANSLAPQVIRVNTVHPSGVNTPMVVNQAFADYVASKESAAASMQNALPIQLIEPEDVANAACWLCTDEARYVTGVALPVDAGQANR